MEFLWYVFEIIGTIAFAVSGALVGIARRMDIFGILVLALTTAIGGGIIRDILVGRIPPNSLTSGLYVAITVLVTLAVFLVYRTQYRKQMTGRWSRAIYLLADDLGLASFTVTGTSVGCSYFPNMAVLAVILGVLTAVGGGMIRDILAKRIPSVLKEEVYALPAIIGGIVYYVMYTYHMEALAAYIAFTLVFIIRLLAIIFKWELPKVQN